jgi:hypothetical protein
MRRPTGPGDRRASQRRQFGRHRLDHRIGEPRIIGNQYRLRCFVVLRLGQQIDRDATRVIVA